MRKTIFLMTPVLSVLAGFGVRAQDAPPAPPAPVKQVRVAQEQPAQGSACPRIEIQNGAGQRVVREGNVVTLLANIQGGDPKVVPQIIWSVNGGSIKDGQQTRKVEVDTSGAGTYREITADIWVGGYAGECVTQASATVRVVPPAAKADEFAELEPEKENERLSSLAASVAQTDDNLFIIAYAGRTSARGYAGNALRRMRTHLASTGLEANRVMVLDGGFREQPAFEVWVVPQGAEGPKAAPTVDRREIVYPRTTPTPVKKAGKP